jgi:hypothetical protein
VNYPFSEVINQSFTPTALGASFGPTWSTTWFKVVLQLPSTWQGRRLHFRWNSDSEATLWSEDGRVLQVRRRLDAVGEGEGRVLQIRERQGVDGEGDGKLMECS